MNQPELGKKIAELRKLKGLTQEELVDRCNLSIRTLQRIEYGEVTPRAYTLKLIFEALEYSIDNSFEPAFKVEKELILKWLEQLYISFIDLFNLKTNTMKKVLILIAILSTISLSIYAINKHDNDKKSLQVQSIIERKNQEYINWYNKRQIDSCLTQFSHDVYFIRGPYVFEGKESVRKQIDFFSVMKIINWNIETFNCSGKLAIERGKVKIMVPTGQISSYEYITEWHLLDKEWFKVNVIEAFDTHPKDF